MTPFELRWALLSASLLATGALLIRYSIAAGRRT